jgi:hypothetical protein
MAKVFKLKRQSNYAEFKLVKFVLSLKPDKLVCILGIDKIVEKASQINSCGTAKLVSQGCKH